MKVTFLLLAYSCQWINELLKETEYTVQIWLVLGRGVFHWLLTLFSFQARGGAVCSAVGFGWL